MQTLKYEDIILYLRDLFKELKTTKQAKAVKIYDIKPEDKYELCNCGCSQRPVAEVYIIFLNNKKCGVRIYPGPTCELVILDCDNRGAIIDLKVYDEIKIWLKKIESSLIRHRKRTDIIKSELMTRVFSPKSFNYGHF